MSKYGKIRRTKSLYKKKKSGFRRVLETAVFVVVAFGIGFVGFTIAQTVIHYTPAVNSGGDGTEATASDNTLDNTDNTGDNTGDTPDSTGDTANPVPATGGLAVYPPSSVLSSILSSAEALSEYAAVAESDGYEALVIELKDDEGRLLYASAIEGIAGDEEVIAGGLTAAEIADAVRAAGLRPVARINTLKDHIAPLKRQDVAYRIAGSEWMWLDNVPGIGKRWANPFLQGTADYIGEVVEELYAAGFAEVILANAVFPPFKREDFGLLSPHITNTHTRFAALGDFVNAVSGRVPEGDILLEIAVSDLSEGEVPVGTAEVLRNKEPSVSISGVAAVFTVQDLGARNADTGEFEGIPAAVKAGLRLAVEHGGGLEVIPLLDLDAGADEAVRREVIAAFEANGYEKYIIRG